jgi:hypothetical protein
MTDCPTCHGEGTVEHPFLQGAYGGSHAGGPSDPPLVECEGCDGTGKVAAATEAQLVDQDRALDTIAVMTYDERLQYERRILAAETEVVRLRRMYGLVDEPALRRIRTSMAVPQQYAEGMRPVEMVVSPDRFPQRPDDAA